MRRPVWVLFWLFVAALSWLACCNCYAQVPRHAVVNVSIGRSCASGVLVGHSERASYVLTCRHVYGPGNPSVTYTDGQRHAAKLQQAEGVSADLLMFCTPRVDIEPAKIAESVEVGEQVWKAGYPAQRNGTAPLNIQTGTWTGPGKFDCYVWSGDSGGGVFNAKGQLLGIISGFGQECSFCSSLQTTKRFLSHWNGIVLTQYCQPGYYCPQPQPQIIYGGTPRPQYPSPSVPGTTPAPQPTEPTPQIEKPAQAGCNCDELKIKLQAIAATMEETQQRLESINGRDGKDGQRGERGEPGLQGKQGLQGPAGPPGKDGKDAPAIDVDAIVRRSADLALSEFEAWIYQQDPTTGNFGEPAAIRHNYDVLLKARVKE